MAAPTALCKPRFATTARWISVGMADDAYLAVPSIRRLGHEAGHATRRKALLLQAVAAIANAASVCRGQVKNAVASDGS